MEVFISYSTPERRWAEKLAAALREQDISTWLAPDTINTNGEEVYAINRAIDQADAYIMLVAAKHQPDSKQLNEWQLALEIAWEDQNKRLIAILFQDAELPNFMRSWPTEHDELRVIRVDEPRKEWERVINDVVGSLTKQPSEDDHAVTITITDRDREEYQARLAYIEKVAYEQLRATAETS